MRALQRPAGSNWILNKQQSRGDVYLNEDFHTHVLEAAAPTASEASAVCGWGSLAPGGDKRSRRVPDRDRTRGLSKEDATLRDASSANDGEEGADDGKVTEPKADAGSQDLQ